MRRTAHRALAVVLLLAAAPACAAIVGDDFEIEQCKDKSCDSCTKCACPKTYDTCNNTASACYQVLSCAANCDQFDDACVQACEFDGTGAQLPGTSDAIKFAKCACDDDCANHCHDEGICG
jgi:hypothetical protein